MMGLSKQFPWATRALLPALCLAFPCAEGFAAGSCRLYANPSLGGAYVDVPEGTTLDLATVGLKDSISSIQLSAGQSLHYWTWNQTNSGDRGIIYKMPDGSYQSTDNRNLNPEYWLNTNDDFDVVYCDNFSRWEAILYADPNKSGGRYYVTPGLTQYLDSVKLKDQVSSVYIRPGTDLNYATSATGWGRLSRSYSGAYSSTAGGADNTPENWLGTNDDFDSVSVNKTMPIYIQRHGVTTDGVNITAAGTTALQNGWNTVDCRMISTDTSIYYLSASGDPSGTTRYTQTAQIVQQALQSHCPGVTASTVPLPVTYLSTFNGTQANAVMTKVEESNSGTRIFIFGSALLHKLTLENDCGSSPCYLQKWPNFMALWNASEQLQICELGLDEDSPDNAARRFMYNNVYRLQRFLPVSSTTLACTASLRIPVDGYYNSSCGPAQTTFNAANTCPPES